MARQTVAAPISNSRSSDDEIVGWTTRVPRRNGSAQSNSNARQPGTDEHLDLNFGCSDSRSVKRAVRGHDAPELDDLRCGVESAVHIFRREGIDDRAREPDQNKVGLIGLQDFGDRDSLVLKLRESHAVARLSESCGDGVSDEALHCRCLAVGATSRKR
jgi:hypothetical protein